jgi:succinate dehydrogenase/fumarate reductase-like Fe-S protein
MPFLDMLDALNEQLIADGEEPVAFDHDCREGICGSCGVMINGQAHGPQRGTATCQLHMRHYRDGDELVIEPFRAAGFPIVKDLVVNRSAFDRIIEAGGYISASTGSAPDANLILVPKEDADLAMDGAACIGCGACVAACRTGRPSCSPRPRSRTSICYPRAGPSASAAPSTWSTPWSGSSARARTPANAPPRARRRSRRTSSPC